MKCEELAVRLGRLQPAAGARDVARLCLLLSNSREDLAELEDEQLLAQAWKEMGLRLQAATDQHAAMMEELERLARSDPRKFTPDQIWVSDPRHQSAEPSPAALPRRASLGRVTAFSAGAARDSLQQQQPRGKSAVRRVNEQDRASSSRGPLCRILHEPIVTRSVSEGG